MTRQRRLSDHPFLPLFDAAGGEKAKDDAITKVRAHADDDWKSVALETVRRICRAMPAFTTDDVWADILEGYGTHEPRAMGAVMIDAAAQRWCVKTKEFRKSRRAVCHRNPKQVWKSLLFEAII